MMKPAYLTTSALVAGLVAGSAQAAMYNFDSAGDLAANFNLASTGTNWSEVASGGPDGSAYVASSGDNGYITEKIAFDLDTSGDTSFTLSSSFLVGSASGGNLRRGLSIGVSTSDTVNYESGGRLEDTSLYGSIFGNGDGTTPNTTNYRYAADTSNPDLTDGLSVGSNDDLPWDTWYILDAIFTYEQSTDLFDITLEVYEQAAGVKGSLVRSIPIGTDIANPFGANPTLYAFVGGRDSADGGVNIQGIDNFNSPAIPEPGSLTLAGLGAVALLRRRRA